MIKRIISIEQFGIFRDFKWKDELPDFGKLNLIYGWNYSGKTTLSRIFQALEHKKLDAEYSAARFQLQLEDDLQVSSTDLSASPPVRVFNRDYVDANFHEDGSAPSIFILGEDNIALRKRLEQLTKWYGYVEKIAQDFSKRKEAIVNELNKLGTDRARDIRDLLGDSRFERPQLAKRIDEVRHHPNEYMLTDPDVTAQLSTLKVGDQFQNVSTVSATLPDFESLAREVNRLLNHTASQRAIERLKQNRDLERWVSQGLLLHKATSTCEFCGSILTTARLEELRAHFSEEYEHLVKEIENKKKEISEINLEVRIPDEMRILPGFRQSFTEIKHQLGDWLEWAKNIREQLIKALEQKREAIERPLKWQWDLLRAAQGRNLLEKLNLVIEQHNSKISNINEEKEKAKTALERHFAARHFLHNEIANKENEIKHLSEKLKRTDQIRTRINSQIQNLEQRIKESFVGATKLNDLFRLLLPDNNIKAVSIGDNRFEFRRNGCIAKYLSDGEKTALTFAYFLTSLEANGATLSDTVVFVDDPVSSLDSNHIYAVYALIVERLENSRQLFVSTHNAELFNLLKSEWLGERRGATKKKDTSAYYIWRLVSPGGEPYAELQELPPLLRKFKSEYEFIFSLLYSFAKTSDPSLHQAFTAPNLLRKFLEAYLGFRKPSVRSWSKKLELLFDSPEERKEVNKFADDASHLQALDRSLQHPYFVSNAQKCVKMVLDALERRDREHYQSLCEIIKEAGA